MAETTTTTMTAADKDSSSVSPASLQLASTTAPGKVFSSRQELQEHYKSDWHKYNLKRRQAGLPMLLEADFQARLEAANALLNEQKVKKDDHLKHRNISDRKKKKKKQGDATDGVLGVQVSSQAAAYDRIKQETEDKMEQSVEDDDQEEDKKASIGEEEEGSPVRPKEEQEAAGEEQEEEDTDELIEIDPRQCLFDRHISVSVTSNVERMQRKYGFFVPDREYLDADGLEGLVGYCQEKIKLGHTCLYCQRVFTTWQGCQKHMISKQHTKLRYEANIDLEDLSLFYDFDVANREFMTNVIGVDNGKSTVAEDMMMEVEENEGDDDGGDDDGWEDISDDEAMEGEEEDMQEEEDEDDDVDQYQEQAMRMGFEVTALGELILPDGRIIGHRALRRYYKQRLRPRDKSVAVEAAQRAGRERLYRGHVYTLRQPQPQRGGVGAAAAAEQTAFALTQVGIAPGLAAGRAGKGFLTSTNNNYNQVSIYRFRAALRKQRVGEQRGKRIHEKTNRNMNKMDKKANNLMNGVIVPKALR